MTPAQPDRCRLTICTLPAWHIGPHDPRPAGHLNAPLLQPRPYPRPAR